MFSTLKSIRLFSILALTATLTGAASFGAQAQQAPVAATAADSAALSEAQKLNLNLLIMATITDQKIAGIVKIDEKVAARYQSLKASYLGSVPTTIVGGAASYLGQESSRKVEFIIAPLTALLRSSGRALTASGEALDYFSKLTGLDIVLRKSFDSSQRSIEQIILPILKVFVNRYTALSSGTSSASGIFAGSIYLMFHDANDVMTSDMARSVLGQNKVILARVDNLISDATAILNLNAAAQAKLKVDIYDEAVRQGVANNFSDDPSKYSLDVISMMQKSGSVSAETAQAVQKLRSLTQDLGLLAPAESIRQSVLENVDMALHLAALLETQLISGQIRDPRLRAEIQRMLGGVAEKLMLIGYNFKK